MDLDHSTKYTVPRIWDTIGEYRAGVRMKDNAKSWGLDWPLYEQKQLLPESNALTSS